MTSFSLPLAMTADDAKSLVGRLARDAARQVRRSTWPTGFAALAAPPGARVLMADGARGRVTERRIEGAGLRLIIEKERGGRVPALAADLVRRQVAVIFAASPL